MLPSLLEFCGDAVFVGHNVALRPRLPAGRLPADRAAPASTHPGRHARPWPAACSATRCRNRRLGTLAEQLRLDHRPSHRALDDALATGDLLHVLLERAGRLGVLGLDDLLAPAQDRPATPRPPSSKLTNHLPRRPGVYLFRDRDGRPLYVGKATNLRTRVRSYFSSDRRRKVAQLLRETVRIDHTVCDGPMEAEVLEVRLIAELDAPASTGRHPRPAATRTSSSPATSAFPRLSVVRTTKDDGAFYLGPLPSSRFAKRVAEAIETSVPLRRCTGSPHRAPRRRRAPRPSSVSPTCPCAGTVTPQEYDRAGPAGPARPHPRARAPARPRCRERMVALARDQRFEEAADVRERAAALSAAPRAPAPDGARSGAPGGS